MRKYLSLIRVKHYIKNILIFLPLIFSGKAFDPELLVRASIGFCSFSLIASTVYIINDIHDLEYDKAHNHKKGRPLASGEVSVRQAFILAIGLTIVAFVLYFSISNVVGWIFLVSYALINIAYSFGLKNIPLVDLSIIVAGFMMRVSFGGAIINVNISSWMHLTVMAMSFYLALGKRRNEIIKNGIAARAVLQHYTEQFLDKMMYVSLGLTIMFYSMWCATPNNLVKTNSMIWTAPLVLLICMKYSMDVEGDSNGDPAEVLFNDKVLLGLVLLYGILLIFIIYWHQILKMIGIAI